MILSTALAQQASTTTLSKSFHMTDFAEVKNTADVIQSSLISCSPDQVFPALYQGLERMMKSVLDTCKTVDQTSSEKLNRLRQYVKPIGQ